MHLKSKEIAYVGILMAVAIVCILVGSYFEISTLFFLAGASFLAGCVAKNLNFLAAVLFTVGTGILAFVLSPQKLYVFTFLGFSVYVLTAQYLNDRRQKKKCSTPFVWCVKGVLYHALLVIAYLLMEKLTGFEELTHSAIYGALKNSTILLGIVIVVCLEGLWLIFDKAYFFFQMQYGHFLQMKE